MDDSVSRQNDEFQSSRPPGATDRVIYSLHVDLEPEPGNKTSGKALVIPLDRGGMSAASCGNGNGRPRPPKVRTIDLRPGDQVLCMGQWLTVKRIRVYRGFWLTDDEAARMDRGGDGYVYRLPVE
jgi:hypothetical protein